jgi:hypothetical protein
MYPISLAFLDTGARRDLRNKSQAQTKNDEARDKKKCKKETGRQPDGRPP